jgi:YD repeat-containing protein
MAPARTAPATASATTANRPQSPAGPAASGAAAASSAALLSTLGLNNSSASSAPARTRDNQAFAAAPSTTISRNPLAAALHGTAGSAPSSTVGGGGAGGGGSAGPLTSSALTLITLDYNDGSVLVPGFDQLATPGGSADLRAQVLDSAAGTYTYSWTTSGLTDAASYSGQATYKLTIHWKTSITTAEADSTTLTVTDPNSNQVSQTYTFWVPAGSGSSTGGTTWNNTTLDPGLIRPDAPAIASDNVSVVALTGALETSINLPSVNPNLAPVSLQYDSLAANAQPIVLAEHPLDPTKATPTKLTAQLTFNHINYTTWYYDPSTLRPGDIMQIGLQANAATLSTGRYADTVQIIDYHSGTPTTFTYNSTATLVNEAQDPTFSPLGAGWTVRGLEKIVSASGGVTLDVGNATGLWFTGSSGTLTSPPGDFSTLVKNGDGTYTRTLTDGTVEQFNSSGLETASIDRNGLHTTFAYSGNLLSTITDPFNKLTTFTNSGGSLLSIKDPANHFTTFTVSGGDLTAVKYPDNNTWNYGYDSSGQMTSVTEPSSAGEPTKIVTIMYDASERVSTITRPDSTTEAFSAAQEQGWTNGGTSTSPAAPTLQAQVGTVYTDPLGNTTTYRPDWRGMGYTAQAVDALGNVTTHDRDANGLATITVDPLNRITQAAYDSHGNVTKTTYPDLTTTTYGAYNSFAEPASMTDQLG